MTPPQSLKKILFFTDFELESIQALPMAAAFARQLGASLALLTVNRESGRLPDLIDSIPDLLAAPEDTVKESVDRLHRMADRFGIPDATMVALQGNTERQISR